MRLEDVPEKYRKLYTRALAGRSRRAAIRCFCLHCVGWHEQHVLECTSATCPLFRYRRGLRELENEAVCPPKKGGAGERHGDPGGHIGSEGHAGQIVGRSHSAALLEGGSYVD